LSTTRRTELDQLSGVAAILRYPLPDLDDADIPEDDDFEVNDEQFGKIKDND